LRALFASNEGQYEVDLEEEVEEQNVGAELAGSAELNENDLEPELEEAGVEIEEAFGGDEEEPTQNAGRRRWGLRRSETSLKSSPVVLPQRTPKNWPRL